MQEQADSERVRKEFEMIQPVGNGAQRQSGSSGWVFNVMLVLY